MDEIILRFPDSLAPVIFKNLDDKSLTRSKHVSRSISSLLNKEVFFWKRIIQKYTNNIVTFKDSWRMVVNKAGKNNTKDSLVTVVEFLSGAGENQ